MPLIYESQSIPLNTGDEEDDQDVFVASNGAHNDLYSS